MIRLDPLIARMLAVALAALFTAAPRPCAAVPKERTEVAARDGQPATVPSEAAASESVATDQSPDDAIGVPNDEMVKVPVMSAIEGAGGPHVGRHKALHGGALVPLGEDVAHLEFVLEPETGLLTLHVLNGDASAPLPIRQQMVFLKIEAGDGEFAIVLFAQPEDDSGVRPVSTSRYMAGHHRLTGKTGFEAVMEGVTIGRQSYRRVRVSYPAGSE